MAEEPRFPQLWFASGEGCQLRSKKDLTNDKGVEGWQMVILPSKAIIRRYGLRTGVELDAKTNLCLRWYPKTSVDVLDDSPSSGRIFVTTNFNGEETNFSRRTIKYTETIKSLQEHIKVLKARSAYLREQLDDALNYQEAFLEKIAKHADKYKEITGRRWAEMEFEQGSENMKERGA